MPVVLKSDQPNHKGIAGLPFVADNHGGLIPWADTVEWLPGWTIPAPSVTGYWLLEGMRNLSHETDSYNIFGPWTETPPIENAISQNGLGILPYTTEDLGDGFFEVTITPSPLAESVIEHAD
jgi:hypothetical protein